MDLNRVRNFSGMFGQIGEVLQTVTKVLEGLCMTLKTTAFIGMVGGAVVARFLEMIKPHIENIAEKCGELSQDLDNSAQAVEDCDTDIANRFSAI